MKLKLGVNIDHTATLRQARYKGKAVGEPDPVVVALLSEQAGADGITAHLREDRRHIQDSDVFALRKAIKTRLNLEMANVPEIVDIALKLKPDIVCIVPERRQEVTTEGGLDAVGQEKGLTETVKRLMSAGIQVSLFIVPEFEQIDAAKRIGGEFIELHTGSFAEAYGTPQEDAEVQRLIAGAKYAHDKGLFVNAGHGINYQNIRRIYEVPYLNELNIGHTIISRAVTVGIVSAVKEMKKLLSEYSL